MFDNHNDKASIFVSICLGTDLLDTNNFIKKHNLGIHQDIFMFLCCYFHSILSLVYISLKFCQEFCCLMSYNLYIYQQCYMCYNHTGRAHTSWISSCKIYEEDRRSNFWSLKEQIPPNIQNMYLLFHIFCNLQCLFCKRDNLYCWINPWLSSCHSKKFQVQHPKHFKKKYLTHLFQFFEREIQFSFCFVKD